MASDDPGVIPRGARRGATGSTTSAVRDKSPTSDPRRVGVLEGISVAPGLDPALTATATARAVDALAGDPDHSGPDGFATLAVGEAPRASRYPLVILTAVAAVDAGDRYLLSSVFPLIKQQFHLSDTALGTLSSAYIVVGTLAVLPVGIWVDRYIRTRIVGWGITIWSFFMILTGTAPSFPALFASRMGLGVAEASYGPASFSLISDYFPAEERGKMQGLFQAGSVVAFILLPIGGYLAAHFGWHAAFEFYALPGFVVAILAWRLPEPKRGAADVAEHARATKAAGEAPSTAEVGEGSAFARVPTLQAFGMVLRMPTVVITLVSQTLSTFFLTGLGIWTITFLVRYHHMTITQAASAQAILGVGAIVGALLGGWLGDRLVSSGIRAGRLYVAAGAQMSGVVLLVPAFAVHSTGLMLLLFAFGAVTLTVPGPPLAAVRADVLHPDLRGRASSVTSLLSVIAGAISPLLFGVISDAAGLRFAFLATLPFMGAGGLLLWVVAPRFLRGDMARMQRQLRGQELPASKPASRKATR